LEQTFVFGKSNREKFMSGGEFDFARDEKYMTVNVKEGAAGDSKDSSTALGSSKMGATSGSDADSEREVTAGGTPVDLLALESPGENAETFTSEFRYRPPMPLAVR